MSDYVIVGDELRHYGIKGMKWGVRKKPEKVSKEKAAYKSAKDARTVAGVNKRVAKKQYDDAYNRAYNYSRAHPVSQFVREKNRLESDRLWDEVTNRGNESNAASRAYKEVNKKYKQAKRDYRDAKLSAKYEKYGLDYQNSDHVANVYTYGYKGAQRIKNRMETKGMSDLKSSTIEAGRQAATGALVTIGALAIMDVVGKYSSPTSQVLDASGNVIKNFYR